MITKRVMVGCALLLAATSASADWYVSGSVGVSMPDDDILDNSLGVRAGGGFMFNENLLIEADYNMLGAFDFADIDGSVDISGFEFSGIGRLPLAEQFAAYGRLGLIVWNVDADIGPLRSGSEDGSDVFFGAGIEYTMPDGFAITGEYNRYSLEDLDLNTFNIGARLAF